MDDKDVWKRYSFLEKVTFNTVSLEFFHMGVSVLSSVVEIPTINSRQEHRVLPQFIDNQTRHDFSNVTVLNHLFITVFCIQFVILFCQEPAYNDIIYGGAWKHVTVNPSKEYTEVGLAEERLSHYVQNSESFLEDHKINYLTCYTLNTLLFSASSREPFLFTKELVSEDGTTYSVSIPIPIGYTYHCEMKTAKQEIPYQHYITVSSIWGKDHIFVLSHIFFPLNYKDFERSTPYSFLSDCDKHTDPSTQNILSTLTKRRDLRSQVCSVKLELQKMLNYRKAHCHSSTHKIEKNASSILDTQLTVMTYNIWNFNPYSQDKLYVERMNRLVTLVANANPGIIGLQEVRLEALRGGRLGPNQMDHLMHHFKQYQYVFQPAQMFESSLNDGRTEEGVAILSKYPIIYHDYLLLFRNTSNSADGHQRICLHAVIDVPKIGQVHVFNTHYSLSHEARQEASRQILKYMELYGGPAFLLGDLNATPDEQSVRMLLKDTGLVDAWLEQNNDNLGYTFNTLESKLSKRIDYILMRKLPGVDLTDIRVMNDNARSNICSDHRAVQAMLSFKSCI